MKKALVLAMALALIFANGFADEFEDCTEAWVLCQPGSYVHVRANPSRNSQDNSVLYSGDRIILDGRVKNGFYHCVLMANEAGEGWVSKGFVVHDKPFSDGRKYLVSANGRVACRRSINGDRRHWLHDGDIITVYMVSIDWCLTNQGFVKTECIDLKNPIVESASNLNADDMTWEED